MAHRPLISDLGLAPISGPSGSILDLVEDAQEEMFDTLPGTSRAELAPDAVRTAEMERVERPQYGPRTDPTEPFLPVQESEALIDHLPAQSGVPIVWVLVGMGVLGAAVIWALY